MNMQALEACLSELKSFKVFQGFDLKEIANLCEGSSICVSRHREQIFRLGDEALSFGVVLSGAYKLTKSSLEGDDVIVHFAIPGDVVAAMIMTQPNAKYPISATALGTSRFLKIPRTQFIHNWKTKPDLIMNIQSLLAGRMLQLQDDKMLVKAPLTKKIASLLLNLLDKSTNQSDGILPLQLTRKEIAESLGASVESIIRIMSDWSKKNIIETSDKQIKIVKVDALIQELDSV